MTGHKGIIKWIDFSYDDRYIVSGAEDKFEIPL